MWNAECRHLLLTHVQLALSSYRVFHARRSNALAEGRSFRRQRARKSRASSQLQEIFEHRNAKSAQASGTVVSPILMKLAKAGSRPSRVLRHRDPRRSWRYPKPSSPVRTAGRVLWKRDAKNPGRSADPGQGGGASCLSTCISVRALCLSGPRMSIKAISRALAVSERRSAKAISFHAPNRPA